MAFLLYRRGFAAIVGTGSENSGGRSFDAENFGGGNSDRENTDSQGAGGEDSESEIQTVRISAV